MSPSLGQTYKIDQCVRDWTGFYTKMSGSKFFLKASKKFFLDGHRIIGRLFWTPIHSSGDQLLLGLRTCGCNIQASKIALEVGGEVFRVMARKAISL